VILRYHRAVQQEVEEICGWYDERKARLGDEFFQETERVLGLIEANPQAFPLASSGRRKAQLKRFPYAIFYRILPDRVRILAVCHDKRHPSYGIGRK
jgi:toxin ParE1/3/4